MSLYWSWIFCVLEANMAVCYCKKWVCVVLTQVFISISHSLLLAHNVILLLLKFLHYFYLYFSTNSLFYISINVHLSADVYIVQSKYYLLKVLTELSMHSIINWLNSMLKILIELQVSYLLLLWILICQLYWNQYFGCKTIEFFVCVV